MATTKEFDILLSKYNKAIAMANDLQEQLSTKQKQWNSRDEKFNITEKLARELCEDILAKDSREMKLGADYSWSSIPLNELIIKAKKVFKEYNAKRTDLTKRIMDTAEDRLEIIDSLKEQLSEIKLNGGRGLELTQDELNEKIAREQEEKVKESNKKNYENRTSENENRTVQNIYTEDSDDSPIDDAYINQLADIDAAMKITPNSVPVSETRKQIEKKRATKKKKQKAHMVNLAEYEQKMSEWEWIVLKIIAEKGYSRFQFIEKEFYEQNPDATKSKCRVAAGNLKNMSLVNAEKVINPIKGSFNVYQLTDMGSRIYKDKYNKNPIMSEMDFIISEHDNCEHGYGIRLVTETIKNKGTFKEVTDENRKKPIHLGDNISYIPDIVCIDNADTKWFIEYECANHSPNNFSAKCNKMAQVTSVLNFIAPNKEAMDKLCTLVNDWVQRRGITSCRHLTVRITGATQLESRDLLRNEGWKYVYDLSKSEKPAVNF